MYVTKHALLIAALGASTISAASSPEKTSEDFDEISSLSTDLRAAIDRMPVLGYDASSVHDLFAGTFNLYKGISEISKANVDTEAGDFSEDEQKEFCRELHRTRYTQGSLIKRLGDQAERISQFPLTPSIGNAIGVYEEEINKFQDELNSRLDNCSDDYQQRLEDAIKTAKAQYAATAPKA
ncbi:uncharacterized protein NECHADRAFT_75467 [Fusarium vanettenii 77-13-4]|uniref:Uncharacterized protein n=1 Tax=Fusarium vanettenii (strain ATCC MYA-4622 / CBS 123669 / FGSC 9596 / NRRL 45880 / 77-13-4) TaxID=660122 RepID=C7YIW4_FUSV7|nr:uncharacterized protein NECHADRAFT_75467 [Fusarium vanettenii 77-13-4]EEU48165.1 predicted protein [Fusarium vanettenii 77-13-4]